MYSPGQSQYLKEGPLQSHSPQRIIQSPLAGKLDSYYWEIRIYYYAWALMQLSSVAVRSVSGAVAVSNYQVGSVNFSKNILVMGAKDLFIKDSSRNED
ncbi:unnamed protein product (macronuclear) [Paramecium tetraurelia]|uniref:Uncharacterized protein n=1 Tax=Paramecium tetraurelia TaxID=5888 RepID=A0BC63_PARTE|nr:uncharacterized protein GSPATT00004224001 [Paramecium tetraurelia]CAK56130.1 unnamed protein product [Paramecium tetraurelia]|eukprot:XP_001423528.1 hypothetical protein (macronuclear) [Paramecium tetraurelia strain d4-2]